MIFAKESLTMTITITAFERSPDGGMGLARDTRVRWALEEAGLPYEVRPVSFAVMKEPAHLALHPFGQIPTYEEGDLVLFESGAIIFHIASQALEQGALATGGGADPPAAGAARRAPGGCRMAGWRVQCGRPGHGVGAAPAATIGHTERVSQPRRFVPRSTADQDANARRV